MQTHFSSQVLSPGSMADQEVHKILTTQRCERTWIHGFCATIRADAGNNGSQSEHLTDTRAP